MSEVLERLIDKRVRVNGVFDKMHRLPTKNYQVALLQDVTVQTEDGQTIDIGHTWLQDADTLVGFDLEENDRFTCSCRVPPMKRMVRHGTASAIRPRWRRCVPRPCGFRTEARSADPAGDGR